MKQATQLGKVTELLPNGQMLVDIGKEKPLRCYMSGKMRINKIKVLIGDTVEYVADDYGNLGRVVRRK